MTTIRVFINERPVTVPRAATVLDAVHQYDAAVRDALSAGTTYVTDGRGIRLDPAASLHAGSILRVVTSRRQSAEESRADA